MPVHDWTRVSAGTFHDFHSAWITAIRDALNTDHLPPDYYAQAEQVAGDIVPDILTLHSESGNGERGPDTVYVSKQRTLAIHHASDDRIIALIEIISPGNKASRHAFRALVEKAAAALKGVHLLLIDLQPPGRRDPQGIHGAIWSEICDSSYTAPADKPLTLVAYTAGWRKEAYIQPLAVGESLPDMPLFLDPQYYISVPLEATYQAAWRGVPRKWQTVLQG